MTYKILNTIGDSFAEQAKKILSGLGEVEYLEFSDKELENCISKYDILIVGLGLNISKDIIKKARNLKVIVSATTGLDHIDLKYAKERDIQILSLKGETKFLNSITGTAELAFGLIIDMLRFTPYAYNDVLNRGWRREEWKGRNLKGKTLGVVGAGRLGRMMIRYGNAFGMDVIFCDPKVEEGDLDDKAKKVSLDEIVEKSDVISIHTHLNESTKGMFDKKIFNKMKKDSILINTSRGDIVNETELLEALKNKSIGGYATDVLSGENDFKGRVPDNYPLIKYARNNNNLVIVPHIGGMTVESREETDIFIANKLKEYLENQ